MNIRREIIDGGNGMKQLTDGEFIEFIEHYKDKAYVDKDHKVHRCYDTATELSRSGTDDADPVVKNSQLMYGLDWMVKISKKLGKQPTKSTDALFINKDKWGNLNLHIIEFKYMGMKSERDKMNRLCESIKERASCDEFKPDDDKCFNNLFVRDFKLIKRNFHDPIEVSLQLKPYEAIFITLPELYDEYCEENGIAKKDIQSYLLNVNKFYWAFVRTRSSSELNIKSRIGKYNNYNRRLERTIFRKAKAKPWHKFNGTLKYEIIGEAIDDDYLTNWSES